MSGPFSRMRFCGLRWKKGRARQLLEHFHFEITENRGATIGDSKGTQSLWPPEAYFTYNISKVICDSLRQR